MKQIIPLVLLSLLSHLFFSCEKEQEIGDLVGIWVWEKATWVSSEETRIYHSTEEWDQIETYHFKNDHTYEFSPQIISFDPPDTIGVSENGNWEISDNILTLTIKKHNGRDVDEYTRTNEYDMINSIVTLTHIWEDKGVEWTVIIQYSKQ